ncbi:AcrB/AcrD/AcrF family protein [Sphingomonas sp. RB56-2]|uniref:AcrB/AcrD/AcrF family protein n=1 Tax=Sphingomonas brevis TaxID=2908206 RepID=A0ABT0SAM2_9SPHN|nr:AcrB/AcrD/AcrF family protein [Sphingomonas brevis]MCL6741388.1 AcrB/AcrD/AcrF family protein [Sphingomonas brevis]
MSELAGERMDEDRPAELFSSTRELFFRHWRWVVVLAWVAYAAVAIANKWGLIQAFALPDTDDNLRMAQVRALLGGQGWFDLIQHRFDPAHGGGNIHWSRLVDLPIAGIILLMKPLVGGADAERTAVAIAPLLPLLLMAFSLALTMKRLVNDKAWPLPVIGLLCAYSTMGMFAPLRIDHHGWQLALLALSISGMADPKRARGGATLGIATGLSLAIGLEMMIYLALLGGATVLLWVADRDQRRRLATYAASLVASTAFGFLLFASYANRQAVCDALSPVWLSDAAIGGAVMLGLAMLKLDSWKARLGGAAVAGITLAGFHALAWPNCLQRLEGVSPEATRLWLDYVREAKPFYRHEWRVAATVIALPATAVFGWALLVWNEWRAGSENRDRLLRILAVALPSLAGLVLLFWQVRAGPAAQMMALPGATALIVLLASHWMKSSNWWLHIAAFVLVLLGFGAAVPLAMQVIPAKKKGAMAQQVSQANNKCPSLVALAPVARQPKGMIFTFIDLGPRLIVATHHDAVGGPYHRNDKMIADVMNAFRGDEPQAHRIIDEYRSDYVLTCPNMSTATIFMSEAPKGFYVQLDKGKVPNWLRPVDLGPNSPFKMWKVVR